MLQQKGHSVSEKSHPFRFYLCKEACLAKKCFPVRYESLEVGFILLFCYINTDSKKCLGFFFSHINLGCKVKKGEVSLRLVQEDAHPRKTPKYKIFEMLRYIY